MARQSPKEQLQAALDELLQDELKRFKDKLNQGGLVEGCRGIPRARLEKADALDVVNLMVNAYTAQVALTVGREALLAIDQRELASRLEV